MTFTPRQVSQHSNTEERMAMLAEGTHPGRATEAEERARERQGEAVRGRVQR